MHTHRMHHLAMQPYRAWSLQLEAGRCARGGLMSRTFPRDRQTWKEKNTVSVSRSGK